MKAGCTFDSACVELQTCGSGKSSTLGTSAHDAERRESSMALMALTISSRVSRACIELASLLPHTAMAVIMTSRVGQHS